MQVSDIDRQIAELQAQKQTLIAKEKDAALDQVMVALKELNALGFHYELHNNDKPKTARRTGVRSDVLKVIQNADGMKPGDIAQALDMDDTKGKQSISNALSALKKAGSIVAVDGMYRRA